jgi:hypothetical protein
MKASLVKTLFNKSIRANLISQDWNLKGHLLYQEIKGGLLKGVYFNSSAFSADQFEPVAFIQPLYVPCDYIYFTFGEGFRTPSNQQWWVYKEDRLEQIGKELADKVNQTENSFLSGINNAKEFYESHKKGKKITVRHFEAVAYSCAYAKLSNAKEELEDLLTYIKKNEDLNIEWVNEIYINTQNLLQSDHFNILNEWENATRLALKI